VVSVGDRWEFEEPAAKSGVFTAGEFRLKKLNCQEKRTALYSVRLSSDTNQREHFAASAERSFNDG